MKIQRFDYYICHMGDDVRMAYTATDAIDFAQRGEPIDNNGFRRDPVVCPSLGMAKSMAAAA